MMSRSQLLERKADLYDALRTLERDHEDGSVDPQSYRISRERYEMEAAEVLEKLDELPGDSGADKPVPRRLSPRLVVVGSLGAALGAMIIFLVTAVHDRANTGAPTAPTPVLPPAVARAEAAVTQHPKSATALLGLGTALMNAGDNADADSAFRQAIKLAPTLPEPPTMHAMVLGSTGKTLQAEAALHRVEREHPRYARAWLLDGLLSSRSPATRAHAILAWKQFLRIQPSGAVAHTVRGLLAQAESRA